MNDDTKLVAGGAVLAGLYLLTRDAAASDGGASSGNNSGALWPDWVPWTAEGDGPGDTPNTADEGEVGTIDGVVYDDPESGAPNDEPGDDRNATFEDVNEVATATGNDPVDPTTYAPDVQDGSTAPSGGVVADPGDSQEWGTAPEQENDDLNDVGNMDGDTASAFDRLANYDSVSSL